MDRDTFIENDFYSSVYTLYWFKPYFRSNHVADLEFVPRLLYPSSNVLFLIFHLSLLSLTFLYCVCVQCFAGRSKLFTGYFAAFELAESNISTAMYNGSYPKL